MNVREHIIKTLEENKGKSISGEQLAKKLNVSRSAIWKSIKTLRSDGYNITAVTNRGYTLSNDSNVISKAGIKAYLSKEASALKLDVRQSISSTNDVLKEYAQNGEKAGYVLVSSEQTKGKGRLGRTFYSPKNTGVYFSILLRPNIDIKDSLLITTSTAVAVSRAIEKLSKKKAEIKWVNDIYIDNKKICGILTEASIDFEYMGLEYAVVGIGVNVTAPIEGVPEDVRNIAGGFTDNIKGNLRCILVAEILNEFIPIMNNLSSRAYLEEYKKRSMLIGREIYVLKKDTKTKATAISIDNDARLVVKYDNGETEALSSGEVSIKL